jgi:hypothetical protein
MSIIFSIATDIYRIYVDEQDKTYHPEHLPQPALILFQRFKKAYESKNILGLKDAIYDKFCGDLYGVNKKDFTDFMQYNFQHLKYGLSPHLVIEIYNISESSSTNFFAVINMKANLKLMGIPISMAWDAGKIICEAKPEGEHSYWRITKLLKFEN